MQAHHEEIEHVMEHISEKGPVRAAEFARTDGKAGGWWEWKPEKRALEHLFAARALMISRRENFHRSTTCANACWRTRCQTGKTPSLRTNRRCGGRWLSRRYARSASPRPAGFLTTSARPRRVPPDSSKSWPTRNSSAPGSRVSTSPPAPG